MEDTNKQKSKKRPHLRRILVGSDALNGTIYRDRTPRRNDPCPCGSGKKYKECCIRDAAYHYITRGTPFP